MESADGDKTRRTSTPPKFTMRTRRQVAKEKRRAEEEFKKETEAKKRKETWEPRENEDVKPQDIIVDPKVFKVYTGHVETEKEVKEEVVLEESEDENSHLEGWDEEIQVFQQDDEIEEEELVARNQQQNVEDKQENVHTEEISVQTEARGIQTEEKGVQTEDSGVDTEVFGVQTKEKGVQTEDITGEEKKNDKELLSLDKVLPNVLPLLNQKDVFRCRLVNKEWRQIVDEFLEDSLVPQHYDDEAYLKKVRNSPGQLCPLPKFRIVEYAYQFKSERSLENFNEKMASHMDSELSPFVGGATVILENLFIDIDQESSDLRPPTKLFLEAFGMHIRRLVVRQTEKIFEFYFWVFVDCVNKCLHYVPNLERLIIVGNAETDQCELTNSQLEDYRKELMDKKELPPKLKKLDTLGLHYSFPKPRCGHQSNSLLSAPPYLPYLDNIYGDITSKHNYLSQLKSLSLHQPSDLLELDWNNLKELSFCDFKCDLSQIRSVWNNVVKLYLPQSFSKVELDTVFEQFPHLRYLTVDREIIDCVFTQENLRENNVHTLEIIDIDEDDNIPESLSSVFPKLRFLVLRFLKIRYPCTTFGIDYLLDQNYDRELINGRVKIAHLICGGTSYDSNLWRDLPHLEIFTFQFQKHDCYSLRRESYCGNCICENVVGRKEECPFKNIVETREGYRRYEERVAQLRKLCFTVGNNLELHDKMFPFILPFLDQHDTLRCRRVNKEWRGIVDNFIKDILVPQHYDDKAYLEKVARYPNQLCPLPRFRNVEYAYHFKSERILQLFNENVVNSELSPFVGGATVTLDNLFVKNSTPSKSLVSPLKGFLERFGVYIQSLVIRQFEFDKGFDAAQFMECLKLCLDKVLNLERLKIVGNWPTNCEQSEVGRIEQLVYELPKLRKLTTLELEIFYRNDEIYVVRFPDKYQSLPILHKKFHDIIIKPDYQTQLKNLRVDGLLVGNMSLKMGNLNELTLNVLEYEQMEIFQLKLLEAPVEKLNLIFIPQQSPEDFVTTTTTKLEINKIVQVFPLVRYLYVEDRVKLGSEHCDYECSNNIHTLELGLFDYYDDSMSHTFFCKFPKLRFLIIRQVNCYEGNAVEEAWKGRPASPLIKNEAEDLSIVNLFYGGTTYDTNIWRVLPKLEVFTCQFQNHFYSECSKCDCKNVKGTKDECTFKNIVETREGYQRFHESKKAKKGNKTHKKNVLILPTPINQFRQN